MTDTFTPDPNDEMLAAEYALGLLQGDELRRFQLRLASEADLDGRVGFWQERLATLTDEVAATRPSATVKARIDIALFGESSTGTPLLARLAFWRGFSLVSLATAAGLAAFLFLSPTPTPTAPVFTAEIAGDASDLRVVAFYQAGWPNVRFRRSEGAATPGRVLELWAIIGDGAPVSVGLLPDGDNGALPVPAGVDLSAGNVTLAISDEPAGGSPTGQPTGDILGAGPVTSL